MGGSGWDVVTHSSVILTKENGVVKQYVPPARDYTKLAALSGPPQV